MGILRRKLRRSLFMVYRVLVLGGGFAGLYAARNIQRLLGKNVDIEIVNRENYFVFQLFPPTYSFIQ